MKLKSGKQLDLPDQIDLQTIPHTGTRSLIYMFVQAGYEIVSRRAQSRPGKVVYWGHANERWTPTRFSVTTHRNADDTKRSHLSRSGNLECYAESLKYHKAIDFDLVIPIEELTAWKGKGAKNRDPIMAWDSLSARIPKPSWQ